MVLVSACVIVLVLWVLLAYVAIPLPFQDPFFAWLRRQWLFEGTAALTFIALVGIFVTSWRKRGVSQPSWMRSWWVWIGWAALSVIWSIDRGLTARSLAAFMAYGLLAYSVCGLVQSEHDLVTWARFLVGAAIVASVEGAFQYTRSFAATLPLLERLHATQQLDLAGWGGEVIRDFLIRKRITSVFGWPNLYAGFLLLMIPSAIGLAAQSRTLVARVGWAVAAGVLGMCLILTLSLGGWSAAILTASLWWLAGRQHSARLGSPAHPWRKLIAAFLGGVALSVVVLTTSLIVAKRAKPWIESSMLSRFVYVYGASNILRAHPVVGTGLGTFQLAYWSLMPKSFQGSQHTAVHAHNTLLEIGADLGLVGLTCFLVFLWRVGRLIVGTMRGPPSLETRWLRQGLAVGLLGFFIHSLLEQTFVESVTAPFWWIVLGLLTGALQVERSASSTRWHVALPLIAACLGLAAVSRWALADSWAARGARLDLAGHHDEARAAFERAQRYDPLTSRYPLEQGERLLKDTASRPSHERRLLLEQAQGAYERTVKLSPWLGYAWLRLGEVRWQRGERGAAIEAMETAVKRDPNSRAAAANWAQMVRSAGRFEELIEAGRAFQRLEPANPLGYFWEALGWERVGTPAQTEDAYRGLLARFPDYYLALFNLATLLRQRGALADAAHYYEAFLRTAPTSLQEARHEAETFLSHGVAGEEPHELP